MQKDLRQILAERVYPDCVLSMIYEYENECSCQMEYGKNDLRIRIPTLNRYGTGRSFSLHCIGIYTLKIYHANVAMLVLFPACELLKLFHQFSVSKNFTTSARLLKTIVMVCGTTNLLFCYLLEWINISTIQALFVVALVIIFSLLYRN